jgi:hypothetical protein
VDRNGRSKGEESKECKDCHRVYVRSEGGEIRALRCDPDLNAKPKVRLAVLKGGWSYLVA